MKRLSIFLVFLSVLILSASLASAFSCGDTIYADETMVGDVTGCLDGVYIGANDITLNCDGYTIGGQGIGVGGGVIISGFSNVTIENCPLIDAFGVGISASSSPNLTIRNSRAPTEFFYGIYLSASSDSMIIDSLGGGEQGIYAEASSNITVINSTGIGGYNAIYFASITDSNIIDSNATGGGTGIFIENSNNNTITNSFGEYNTIGIYLSYSNENLIIGNDFKNAYNYGMILGVSSDNDILNNQFNSNVLFGLAIYTASNNNTVIGNTMDLNSDSGIVIADSSLDNLITGNTASLNSVNGILVADSTTNWIYNNIFNNTNNVLLSGGFGPNDWNRTKTSFINIIGGQYLGGNYWTSPAGNGFSDNCMNNGQGICVENYTLGADNVDMLALTSNQYYIPINISKIVPTTFILKQDLATNISILCFKEDGDYCTGAICKITIFNPDGSLLVSNGPMTYSGTSYFNYQLNESQTHLLGEYSASAVCSSINNVNVDWEYLVTPTGKEISREIVYVYIFFLLVCLLITFLSVRLTISNPMQKDEMTSDKLYQVKKRSEVKFYLNLLKKKMWILGVFGIYLSIFAFISLMAQLTFSLGITELTSLLLNASQIMAWGFIPFIVFWIVYLVIFFWKSTEEMFKYQFGGMGRGVKHG